MANSGTWKVMGLLHFFVLTISSGCDSGSQAAVPFVTFDSAGIVVIENYQPEWHAGTGWTIPGIPILDIGGLSDEAGFDLFRVVGVIRLQSGSLVVGNAGAGELQFFSKDGVFLNSSGGTGDGPGEFQRMRLLRGYRGDSLAVFDSEHRRVSIFSNEGSFSRSFRLAPFLAAPVFVHEILPLPDGSIVAGAFPYRSRLERVEGGTSRDTTTVIRCTPQGELIDTIGRFPAGEFFSGPDVPRWDVPFARGSSFAISPGGLVFGDNETPGFDLVGFDGGPQKIIRRDRVLQRVSEDDVTRWKQLVLEGASDNDTRQTLRDLAEQTIPPETMPAYQRVLVDLLGYFWIEEHRPFSTGGGVWTVFDPNGRLLGEVATPPGLQIHQIGEDFVLGVWRDELEIDHVQMYTLNRTPSSG